jgi:sulfite oxidase
MSKHEKFIVHSASPYNAEPPLELLRENFVTPNELFYARNHGNIPEMDAPHYRLVVDGMVERALEFSLDTLLNDIPKRTVMATMQCAGNRRDQLMAVQEIPGEVPWAAGAIGNAFWSGVPLKEILNAAGVKLGAQYIAMTGADDVMRHDENVGFGGSIALDKALANEVLLAYEMNGKPLEPIHGYPLRLLVPGYIGARSVKWLTRLTLQTMPSQNYFQAHAYQLFPPQTSAETADWNAGLQLSELAVNCVITSPRENDTITPSLVGEGWGEVLAQGYALSGGRKIARVDVSSDGGNSWTTANLTQGDQQWAWTFWETKLRLDIGDWEIVARAFDSASNTQPKDARHVWNFKGYMNNAWHRVRVRVEG